jgi:hypothetical protein
MSERVDDNPWRQLPKVPPYILLDDEPYVRDFNLRVGPTSARYVQVKELLPEAYLGIRNAPVILLSNNPGIGKRIDYRTAFASRIRENLLHEQTDWPFPFLHPEFQGPWWRSKLKELIREFDLQTIARSVFNVVYFPYASRRFGHGELGSVLRSQKYSFRLVKEAVNRNAVIVRMRRGEDKRKLWVKAVPELENYPRLYCVNSQNAAVSRNNCDNFEDIVEAIRASL